MAHHPGTYEPAYDQTVRGPQQKPTGAGHMSKIKDAFGTGRNHDRQRLSEVWNCPVRKRAICDLLDDGQLVLMEMEDEEDR